MQVASEIQQKFKVETLALNLDVAVNNAGIASNENAENMPDSMWDEVMNVSLRGVFLCCRDEARIMMRAGKGSIINTASMSALIVNNPQKQAYYSVRLRTSWVPLSAWLPRLRPS